MYEVQTNTICDGWVNVWGDDEGNLITYDDIQAAYVALAEHIQDMQKAVEEGHIEDFSKDDWRVSLVMDKETLEKANDAGVFNNPETFTFRLPGAMARMNYIQLKDGRILYSCELATKVRGSCSYPTIRQEPVANLSDAFVDFYQRAIEWFAQDGTKDASSLGMVKMLEENRSQLTLF